MRLAAFTPALLAASSLAAQNPRIVRVEPNMPLARAGFLDAPRAVIGITTSSAASSRDTLGVLVSSVRSGSPAEKAGIEEGNRVASINGVSLKLNAADVGDEDMAGVMTRRLTRELDKLKPGDEVDLRVYADGQTKSIRVKTVSPDDLYETAARRSLDDRASLGIQLASTGSHRDSIGVFVVGVDDDGPAAKAGIQEGSRIASINNVDVRTHRSDEDEWVFRSSGVQKLEREVSRLKPGDEVTLRVYYNGQYRNVTLKAARASDLARRNRSMTIIGGDNLMIMPGAGGMGRGGFTIDTDRIGETVRRAIDGAGVASRAAVDGAMLGMRRGLLGFGNRVSW